MTEFAKGFWLWATDHWILGFILLVIALWGFTAIVTSLLKVFRRHPPPTPPAPPKIVLNTYNSGGIDTQRRRQQQTVEVPPEHQAELTELVGRVRAMATNPRGTASPAAPGVRVRRTEAKRSTVWDRIRANADDED